MSTPEVLRLYWTTDALEAIRRLRDEEGGHGTAFRVDVRLGGCQGFKLYFDLDTVNDDDQVFAAAPDIEIVVQRDGMPLISGGVLDYEDSHRGRGFRIANPNAEKSCGCGQAFYANFETEEAERSEASLIAAEPREAPAPS